MIQNPAGCIKTASEGQARPRPSGPAGSSARKSKYNQVIGRGLPIPYILSSKAVTVQLPLLIADMARRDGLLERRHGRASQERQEVHTGQAPALGGTKAEAEEENAPRSSEIETSSPAGTEETGRRNGMTLSQRINDFFDRGAWRDARQAILRALKRQPHDHWLLSRLSTTFYEERNYQEALEYAREAARIDPTCPLVLWDFAGALDAVGDKEGAIKVYRKLLARGIAGIANDKCGEGAEWAASLIADCKIRTAACYMDEYLEDIRSGTKTIYVFDYQPTEVWGATPLFTLTVKQSSAPTGLFSILKERTTIKAAGPATVFSVSSGGSWLPTLYGVQLTNTLIAQAETAPFGKPPHLIPHRTITPALSTVADASVSTR